jgi:hypothetical protein
MRRQQLNVSVDRDFVRKLLEAAHAFDLEQGGLYDARSGLVNVWCSPEDQPACWDAEITCGGLTHSRAYVGALGWDWLDDDRADLFVEAAPYDLLKRRPRRQLPETDWAEILVWLRSQALALTRLAALQPRVTGTRCPFCHFVLPVGELLNSLLDHIGEAHPTVRMRGIDLGHTPVLRTDEGDLPLRPDERFD